MEKYASKMMELAPRDIVSRSEMTEILEGRGFRGRTGWIMYTSTSPIWVPRRSTNACP